MEPIKTESYNQLGVFYTVQYETVFIFLKKQAHNWQIFQCGNQKVGGR